MFVSLEIPVICPSDRGPATGAFAASALRGAKTVGRIRHTGFFKRMSTINFARVSKEFPLKHNKFVRNNRGSFLGCLFWA